MAAGYREGLNRMKLRIFSVVGEALNFGGRRMDTIARVAWLPVALLLIANMVTVFAYLSVIAGRVVTFKDAGTFATAQQVLAQYLEQAWEAKWVEMATITGVSFAVQGLLTASFMAPLIRYSGLGERPHRGLIRMPFGPDQLRYILSGAFSFLFIVLLVFAPLAGATYYILKYIFDGLSKTLASFPDPNSLHTIEFITAGQQLAAGEGAAYLNFGVPLIAAVPFALLLWALVYFHFHPSNRPNAPERGNPILRALTALLIAGLAAGVIYGLMREDILEAFKSVGEASESIAKIIANTPANAHVLIGAIIFILAGYLNLRLYPYPGVAVCRKSLGLGGTLQVSRGWNLIRLQLILLLVGVFIFFVQTVVINYFLLTIFLPSVVSTLYQAVAVSTKLTNSGVTSEWVAPLFIWIWNGIKIFVNIIGVFFSFGVLAGLYGRLYRESEREFTREEAPAGKPAIWRRA